LAFEGMQYLERAPYFVTSPGGGGVKDKRFVTTYQNTASLKSKVNLFHNFLIG
jgi:hypothetical protein